MQFRLACKDDPFDLLKLDSNSNDAQTCKDAISISQVWSCDETEFLIIAGYKIFVWQLCPYECGKCAEYSSGDFGDTDSMDNFFDAQKTGKYYTNFEK